jgi:hypothetical protein
MRECFGDPDYEAEFKLQAKRLPILKRIAEFEKELRDIDERKYTLKEWIHGARMDLEQVESERT